MHQPDIDLAVHALRRGDVGTAAQAATRARRAAPTDVRAVHVYVLAALTAKDYEHALPAALHCVELDGRAEHHFDVAAAYHGLGEDKKAARWFRSTLALDPNHVPAMMALAACLAHVGLSDEVRALHDRALTVEPTNAAIRHVQGMIRIYRGDYARGWPEHEARWDAPWVDVGWRPPGIQNVPRWKGEQVGELDEATRTWKNGRLVVYAEQGLGDSMFFARYLPYCATKCSHLTVVVQPSLVRLFQHGNLADEVLAQEVGVHGSTETGIYHARAGVPHCPMMSLPAVCGTTSVGLIPHYPNLFSVQRRRHQGVRIGVCWSGRGGLAPDHDRSAPPSVFEPLRGIEGVTWVALQRDAAPRGGGKAGRSRAVEYPWMTERLPASGDWLDTAEFIADLDLVVTVDTAISHLSAALGIETWCFPPTHIEWRCREGAEYCDWWKTMKYYRRRRTHDWRAVVERVVADLQRWVSDGNEAAA